MSPIQKFLEIVIENTWSWKINRELIIIQISAAYYAIRSAKPYLSQKTLKIVYYYYFHSIMNFRLMGTLFMKCKNVQDTKEYN